MLKEVLTASLGRYVDLGFELVQTNNRRLDLLYKGEAIKSFNSSKATVFEIRQACEKWLRRN